MALLLTAEKNEIMCLITIAPKNPESYMFHKPGTEFVKFQAEALGLPLIFQTTHGKKEKELEDLRKAIKYAKEKYNIEGVVTGALASNYQASRIQRICEELKLRCFNPLWRRPQREYLTEIIKSGIKSIITAVAADGMGKDWIGKEIDENTAQRLMKLEVERGIQPSGEGGEYETFVLDCPLFKKRIIIKKYKIIWQKNSGYLKIEDVVLEEK